MTRAAASVLLALALLAVRPSTAFADVTGFFGLATSPTTRPARGFAFGINLLIVGFEFEYGRTSEDAVKAAPDVQTYMFNGMLMTPTGDTSLYVTAGGGMFRERFGETGETNFGTNIGGGLRIGLVGPLRLRFDYRIFNLRGTAKYKTPQRFYAGVNIAF
jgi:opacity protein-like surface antigen